LLPTFKQIRGTYIMSNLALTSAPSHQDAYLAETASPSSAISAALRPGTPNLLERMFRDPRVLEQHERLDLVAQLRSAVELAPQIVELRVMLGMALCVNLEAQEAMEELHEAVNMAPNNFIAQLKYGELMMRLRICDKAAEHTHEAARLAINPMQSELARKQAATIRTMMREGIERGGYGGILSRVFRKGKSRKEVSSSTAPVLVGTK
jgi:tetratricopeptide (TPR) repeat protein